MEEKIVTKNEKGEIEVYRKGIGRAREIGKLDLERLIRILLKNKQFIS